MILTLRKKLIIGFITLDIVVSFLLGIFMYQFSYEVFLTNFKSHKVTIAKFLSAAMNGDEHQKFTTRNDLENTSFLKYRRLLEKIYNDEKSIWSVYTLNYNSNTNNFNYAVCVNMQEKGHPCLDPGSDFIEDGQQIAKLRNIIQTRSVDNTELEIQEKSYGNFMSVYSIIYKTTGEGIGIIALEVSTREIEDFQRQMAIVALSLTSFTFLVTTIVAFFLASYFTRPLEILNSAVDNLASGNLIMIDSIHKKDEFGSLAKSFNVMVNNLKNSSEVQYNLIVEISNLNESLERKVEARTHTIHEQSQELEKQIMIAKKIQLSLLPEDVPKINGATLSFRYQPMMGVGGDFIDFDYKNDNDLLLFICDVSGHGVPAAFLATMVKMSLQDCYEMQLTPSESLKKIHRALQGKLSGHFISAIFCHINLQDGIMTSANAGHLPMLKIGLNGEYELINSRGRIICEAFPTNSEEIITLLEIGDKIILYTDGITEARGKNQKMFGDEKLIEVSLQNHFDSSFDLCNKIYDSVLSFTENSQSQFTDDITILVAEYLGEV